MNDRQRLLRAILRQSLTAFVEKCFATLEPGATYQHTWHIDHVCWQLERVASGAIRRLIINVPPRSMKSIMASVAFPAWVMGHDPTKRIICVSYAEELARKLSTDTKSIMETAWFQSCFPALQFATRRPRTMELATTLNGYRFAAGMNGSILGRGADLIVIDDPIKPSDAFSLSERRRVAEAYDTTLFTRLNDKSRGAIVLIMQRLHENDLVGHVMARDDWEVVSLPAIATEAKAYRLSRRPAHIYQRPLGEVLHAAREPLDVLEHIRRAQGSLVFSAQYQQSPTPPEGNVVRRDWMRTYETRPASFDFVVASWDTASTLSETSDYSVGTVWGASGLEFYLLDLVRGRFEAPELRRRVAALSRLWNVDQTLIEDTETGRAVEQDLRRTGTLRTILQRPKFDKEARFLMQSARFEAGQVYAPANAPWLAEWMGELLAFPNAAHDDQVDSTSQALSYLTWRAHRGQMRQTERPRPVGGPRPAGCRMPRR